MQLEAFTGMVVPAETKFFMKSVSNREELYKSLNISVSLSGNYGFFAGDLVQALNKKTPSTKIVLLGLFKAIPVLASSCLKKLS